MQIHELDNFSGSLGAGAFFAVDDGTDTGKVSTQQILAETEAEIANVNARIDNIIAGGDAPSAAEVKDGRLGVNGVTFASLGTAIRTQIEEANLGIQNSNNGVENFGQYGGFRNGSLNSSGGLSPSVIWRICTLTEMTFDRDLIVTVASGFRFGYQTFVGGTMVADSGWLTGVAVIPAGTTFKIAIARVTEDQSETADIPTFLSKVTFFAYDNVLNDINAAGLIRLFQLNWQNKSYQPPWAGASSRASNMTPLYNENCPIRVRLDSAHSGYSYGVTVFDGSDVTTANLIRNFPSWIAYDTWTTINPGEYAVVTIRKNDNSAINIVEAATALQIRVVDPMIEVDNILNGSLDPDMFAVGGWYQGKYLRSETYPHRVGLLTPLKFGYDVTLSASDGYVFGVQLLSSSGAFVLDTGWIASDYTVPANTYFGMTIRENPEATGTPDVDTYVSAIKAYGGILKIATTNKYSYDSSGYAFKVNKTRYNASGTNVIASNPSSVSANAYAFQGFGYYNGVILQFYSDDGLELLDMSDGSIIADLTSPTQHGNAVGFLKDFHTAGDEFPMAIVSDATSNGRAYQVRITRSTVTLLKTLTFPVAQAGYYANVMVDALNEILYTVGYTENSYNDNTSGENDMIFAKWDFSQLTDNGDSTYTPQFIDSFTTPFMDTLQGPAYHNGNLFVVSSPALSPSDTNIFVVDPERQKIVSVMNSFPTNIKTIETEGICFAEDDNGDTVALIKTGANGTPYYKLSFNQ